jgi:glutamine synthetase
METAKVQEQTPTVSEDGQRGVASVEAAREWLAARRIEDIECIVPDQAGVARGKMMPVQKFLAGPTMTMPVSIFTQTITGDYPEDTEVFRSDPADQDILLRPDFSTLSVVPWEADPTAQLIHDAFFRDGRPVEIAPRQVLQKIIGLYAERGWQPVVAPEIEFYLVKPNKDPDYPLEPPTGRSGRAEAGRQSYSIAAINEFDELFDEIYDFSGAQGLEIDTLIHEEGAAQMEINLRHGDPLQLADQVFLFKRTIREAALRHDMYATFMAKPMSREPGSAMHIHQSVVDKAGRNIFSDEKGEPTPEFFAFIAGSQKYLPAVTCIFAPYVNSYRRLVRSSSAPVNVMWGYDNRTVALRVPFSDPAARRLENRLPSSDANPYLAIAASLACGYLGLSEALKVTDPAAEGAANDDVIDLPRGLLEAVALFEECEPLVKILGKPFVSTYTAIKKAEFETFMQVISPWEREYLLLNV